LGAGPSLAQSALPKVGLQPDVTFADYPALAQNSELVRRMATPLALAEMRRILATTGKALAERSLDLPREHFLVYVPPTASPKGYGLFVFISPWNDARLPPGWAGVLDRSGVIFVTAANSGNEASPIGRRQPLALIAEQNIERRYRVDAERVFVGGFSGGSRVALRLALGYPDVFRGVMLNAGSDPIGDAAAPLPPTDLYARFQRGSRLVYVTGGKDEARLANDVDSMSSMRRWCVAGVMVEAMPYSGHQAPDAATLGRVLADLQTPVRADPTRLAACRSTIDRDLAKALGQVGSLIALGRRDEAHRRLIKLDARFGGLAAPRSLDLAGK